MEADNTLLIHIDPEGIRTVFVEGTKRAVFVGASGFESYAQYLSCDLDNLLDEFD